MVLVPRHRGCRVRLIRPRVDAGRDEHVRRDSAHTGATRYLRAQARMPGISGISPREAGTNQCAARAVAVSARPAGSALQICQDRCRTGRVRRTDLGAVATRRAQDRRGVPRVRRPAAGRACEDGHEFVSGSHPYRCVRSLSASCARRAQPRAIELSERFGVVLDRPAGEASEPRQVCRSTLARTLRIGQYDRRAAEGRPAGRA
jgi:hypothetical protein